MNPMALFNLVWISNSKRKRVNSGHFSIFKWGFLSFFMVVLMQYIKQQIKFFTIIDNQTNVGHISVPDFWYHDNDFFFYLNPVVLNSKLFWNMKTWDFHHLGLCETKWTDSGNSLICCEMLVK